MVAVAGQVVWGQVLCRARLTCHLTYLRLTGRDDSQPGEPEAVDPSPQPNDRWNWLHNSGQYARPYSARRV
jgi:hypothetical protein